MRRLLERLGLRKVYTNSCTGQGQVGFTRTLCEMAREYAERLGLDPLSIQPYYRDSEFGHGQRINFFVDHYWNPR